MISKINEEKYFLPYELLDKILCNVISYIVVTTTFFMTIITEDAVEGVFQARTSTEWYQRYKHLEKECQ